jgi:hypothetical protein
MLSSCLSTEHHRHVVHLSISLIKAEVFPIIFEGIGVDKLLGTL